jgi:ceramide synthetase
MHDGRVQLDSDLKAYQLPAAVKIYYLLESGWYFSGFVLLLMYKRKKDFVEMATHHIVTFLLLFLSYNTGYIRVGLVVIILHNAFDPFLHLAKCTHYVNIPVLPDVSFACCALSFTITRLFFYPQAIWYAWAGVCAGTATCPGGTMDKTGVEFTLIGLLWALVPIHIVWWFMILKVLKKALLHGAAQGDNRSDSDSESDGEKTPIKVKKVN